MIITFIRVHKCRRFFSYAMTGAFAFKQLNERINEDSSRDRELSFSSG